MRIARRLTLFLIAGMLLVFAVYGAVTVNREVGLFETDMLHDHRVLGRSLATAASEVWAAVDEHEAVDLVQAAKSGDLELKAHWVRLDGPNPPRAAELSSTEVEHLLEGDSIHRVTVIDRIPTLVSAFPVPHSGHIGAAVEIRESLASRDRYVRVSIRNTVLTTLALAGLSSILAAMLGVSLVGRPVRALVAQARRVGRGELDHRLKVHRRDELGELATEMNAMCDQLDAAHRRVESETAARIATLEQLRHADRLMTVGKLASGIAHELGTPLNVVSGRAKMIERGQTNADETKDAARIIGEQSARMARIIRQLLDFARRRGPKKAAADIAELAGQVASLLTPMATKHSVEIEVTHPDELPTAECDVSQIQQVVTNLVVNAIQAMKDSGRVRLELSAETRTPPPDVGGTEARFVRLDVCDTGTGIDPAVLEHVFEPFVTTKDVGEGTGLGLSVAYGIVREHGGFIELESKLGEGTRFSVYLPATAS
jgi:two-component system NtrC family sensor kinase